MKQYENECVCCGDYCIGCGRTQVLNTYCDVCNDCVQKYYKFRNKDYCEKCLISELVHNYADEIIDNHFQEILKEYDIAVME